MNAGEKAARNTYYTDTEWHHVGILDQEICRARCKDRPCLKVCPGEVFRWNEEEKSDIRILYQQCLECGACRLICPQDNIFFEYPRGGFGILHRYG